MKFWQLFLGSYVIFILWPVHTYYIIFWQLIVKLYSVRLNMHDYQLIIMLVYNYEGNAIIKILALFHVVDV